MPVQETVAREARSGLPAWNPADLPAPPTPRGLQWIGVVGPGVIVLGLSIGAGEFLLGPAVFVRYGLTLLWVTVVAVLLQTVFNTELMRYTVATGEPVFTGFMRTRPSSKFWAVVYSVLYLLQAGWPAWAANAAGAIFFLFMRRLASPADADAVYLIGVATFVAVRRAARSSAGGSSARSSCSTGSLLIAILGVSWCCRWSLFPGDLDSRGRRS